MKFLVQPLYSWYRAAVRNSKYRWLIMLGSLLYLISPVDLVTDALPIIGWIDDGVIVTVLVSEISQLLLEQRNTRKAKGANSNAIAATGQTA